MSSAMTLTVKSLSVSPSMKVTFQSATRPSTKALKRPRPSQPWRNLPRRFVLAARLFQLSPRFLKRSGASSRVMPEPLSRVTTRSSVRGPWWNSTSTRAASASSAFQMHSVRAARGVVLACRLRWSDRAATWKTCSPPAPSTRKPSHFFGSAQSKGQRPIKRAASRWPSLGLNVRGRRERCSTLGAFGACTNVAGLAGMRQISTRRLRRRRARRLAVIGLINLSRRRDARWR
jgi:hypothetical protein